MLQIMREKMKGPIAIIIVGLLGLLLALGLVNLNNQNHGSTAFDEIVSVDGESITERDLLLGIEQERQRLISQFGENFPESYLSDERLREPVLKRLISRKVLVSKAEELNFSLKESEIDRQILQLPSFQSDGIFDPDLFTSALRSMGFTALGFKNIIKQDYLLSQYRQGVLMSSFMGDSELQRLVALSNQTRSISILTLPIIDQLETATVTDEEAMEYYDDNKHDYLSQEQVSIEYIDLNVDNFLAEIIVTEQDVRQEYDAEIFNFSSLIKRQAAHILVDSASDDAQQRIEVIKQALEEGEDFATLAEKYSDDFGSKDAGGYLGESTGDSFPPAFEEILATLEVGEVSAPIKIDGNTHFIRLENLDSDQPPSFAERRDQLEKQIKNYRAEQKYLEVLTSLKDLSYNADSLQSVANQLNLEVKQTEPFTSRGGTESILRDRKVVEAAFSNSVLVEGYTSEVLELSPKRSVVLNVIDHKPVRTLTFEEKQDDIVEILKLQKAKKQLEVRSNEIIELANSGQSLDAIAENNKLSIKQEAQLKRDNRTLSSALISHVFSLPKPLNEDDNHKLSSIWLPNNDRTIILLESVNDGNLADLSEEEQRSIRASQINARTQAEYFSWEQYVIDRTKVKHKQTAGL